MKKVLIIVGSNHSYSINRQLAEYAGSKLSDATVTYFDLQDVELPMYSIDNEKEHGHPAPIVLLHKQMEESDSIIIVSPEHNGLMPAALKNAIDWLSRVGSKFLAGKPVVLLSTSPGATGGANNLKILGEFIPWWGGNLINSYSLGSFAEKFNIELHKITDKDEIAKLDVVLHQLQAA